MAAEGVLATLRARWDALSGVDVPKAVIGGLLLVSGDFQREVVDRTWLARPMALPQASSD